MCQCEYGEWSWKSPAMPAGSVPNNEGVLRSGANEPEPHRCEFVLWLGWVRANKCVVREAELRGRVTRIGRCLNSQGG